MAMLSRGIVLVLLAGALLRLALIVYSIQHDARHAVKYTDIDYKVFSDASKFLVNNSNNNQSSSVAKGILGKWSGLGDPYDRDTYRYTPILAIMLLPNSLFHPAWGKLLFATFDIIIGYILLVLSSSSSSSKYQVPKSPRSSLIIVTTLWLLNPFIANISTRGSSESFLGLFVLSTLAFAEWQKWNACAVTFATAVHIKLYPIIYITSLLLKLHYDGSNQRIYWIVNKLQIRFCILSFVSFLVLNLVVFSIWGWPFIENTYLYHLHRLDHRHNFSSYFYPLYLSQSKTSPSLSLKPYFIRLTVHPLASFLPQFILSFGLGIIMGKRESLSFAWFVQTMAFVVFNKVCTSQYFLWYLWLLPLVVPRLEEKLSLKRLLALSSVWISIQAIWLGMAYRLEILGEPVFRNVWFASVLFFIGHGWILGNMLI